MTTIESRSRGLSFHESTQFESGTEKRARTGSISGRLRTCSDLAEYGVISAIDKGFVKVNSYLYINYVLRGIFL